MTIFVRVTLPNGGGYTLTFNDAKRAARAYSKELVAGGATVSVNVQFDRP